MSFRYKQFQITCIRAAEGFQPDDLRTLFSLSEDAGATHCELLFPDTFVAYFRIQGKKGRKGSNELLDKARSSIKIADRKFKYGESEGLLLGDFGLFGN